MRPSRGEREFPAAGMLALALALPATVGASVDGGRLYDAACAACHGHDGRGLPREVIGFEEPLPDFTDCRFATREPNADWLAVSHEGGPARAFSKMMPAFGAALEVAEIEAILGHIRGFCTDLAWPRGELNLPRPFVTTKAYPEDEAVLATAFTGGDEGEAEADVLFEKRIGARNQVEILVPFRWKERASSPAGESAGGSSSGLGDIVLGFKRALAHSLRRGSIFSLAAEVKLPTGDEDKGLGSGTTIFEPFLAFGQLLPREGFIHLQGGFELPTDSDKAEDEAFLRLAIGRAITHGPWGRSWSPMLEVLAARELQSGADAQWDLLPQLQVTLNQRQHVMANIGVRLPLDDDDRDHQILFYLLWDWFDGGLLDGW